MPRELKPCGTLAAYRRHLRKKEEPCEPCRDANTQYAREHYPTWHYQGARQRALYALARAHREEYAALRARGRAAGNSRSLVSSRAYVALTRRYPKEFAALLKAERARADAQGAGETSEAVA